VVPRAILAGNRLATRFPVGSQRSFNQLAPREKEKRGPEESPGGWGGGGASSHGGGSAVQVNESAKVSVRCGGVNEISQRVLSPRSGNLNTRSRLAHKKKSRGLNGRVNTMGGVAGSLQAKFPLRQNADLAPGSGLQNTTSWDRWRKQHATNYGNRITMMQINTRRCVKTQGSKPRLLT
jgi:hypothetical protein